MFTNISNGFISFGSIFGISFDYLSKKLLKVYNFSVDVVHSITSVFISGGSILLNTLVTLSSWIMNVVNFLN